MDIDVVVDRAGSCREGRTQRLAESFRDAAGLAQGTCRCRIWRIERGAETEPSDHLLSAEISLPVSRLPISEIAGAACSRSNQPRSAPARPVMGSATVEISIAELIDAGQRTWTLMSAPSPPWAKSTSPYQERRHWTGPCRRHIPVRPEKKWKTRLGRFQADILHGTGGRGQVI